MLPGTSRLTLFHLRAALLGAVACYTLGYLLWYSATALGLYPVLDGREQLELAKAIAAGTLPHEPFYRAPLYPALVARLLAAGVEVQHLPFAARALNGALHLANTWLVWLLAWRAWRAAPAATLAALLYGLHPVALFFAADPLDLTLAVTFVLGALLCALRGGVADVACASALLGAAMLARPQTLLLWPVLVLMAWCATPAGRASRLAAAVLPWLLVAALMGCVNRAVGGAFVVLPWQGAYNLWAANGPQADGRYFVQRSRIAVYSEGVNPARIESERLYRAANPGAPDDYASMSRYWNARTLAALRADPLRWFALAARKAWYLANDFEQYDLKTYFVHKAASPWLRWNPLRWGVLFSLGAAALALHWRARAARWVALFALAYAGGLLLSYVSARFRLPLAPLLAVLAGGVLAPAPRGARWRGALAGVAVAVVAFWPLPAAERVRTVTQDYLLTSRAALSIGDTAQAVTMAGRALAAAPGDAAARELLCVAHFNAWLRGTMPAHNAARAPCEDAAPVSPAATRALGLLRWRAGDEAGARALWRRLAARDNVERDAARAALIMTGDAWTPLPRATLAASADELLLARALAGDADAAALLARRLPPAEVVRQTEALRRLFARDAP